MIHIRELLTLFSTRPGHIQIPTLLGRGPRGGWSLFQAYLISFAAHPAPHPKLPFSTFSFSFESAKLQRTITRSPR
jgi:hypothetical protein